LIRATVMFQRLDRADRQHRQQIERHIRRAEVFEHVARQRERQPLPAEFGRRGNRVPALFDIGAVGRVKPFGQPHNAVLQPRAFQIADTVQEREFPGGELPHAFDDGFDQIGFGMGEAGGLGQFLDPGIDANGEQLVGGWRGIGGHGGVRPLAWEVGLALGRAKV